ncbi:hypothetical protein [Vulcanisaeta sp. JCM 14467]|uniref:hypothetical protein n=1 Tax=Vulcanisaeta sp. JCM 14467 TaxID=1295370 RepID=UPI0006D0CE4B|nr:hypothetical protein [Vulcanisaeta sp. JCM 14467]
MEQTLLQRQEQRHRCGISDIKEFLMNYVLINCRRNIMRDNEYKITMACFHAWHQTKYGTRASQQCIRTLVLYLPAVAQEMQLKIEREGNAKYIITK